MESFGVQQRYSMSGYLLKFKQTYSVKIGGRRYPVVKIGNQLWMAENLDIELGTLNTDYKVDSARPSVGKYYAMPGPYSPPRTSIESKLTPLLPEGWHLPSEQEIRAMASNFNTVSEMTAVSDGGTDTLGLAARKTGYYAAPQDEILSYDYTDVAFMYGSYDNIWNFTEGSLTNYVYYGIIRLVKNA